MIKNGNNLLFKNFSPNGSSVRRGAAPHPGLASHPCAVPNVEFMTSAEKWASSELSGNALGIDGCRGSQLPGIGLWRRLRAANLPGLMVTALLPPSPAPGHPLTIRVWLTLGMPLSFHYFNLNVKNYLPDRTFTVIIRWPFTYVCSEIALCWHSLWPHDTWSRDRQLSHILALPCTNFRVSFFTHLCSFKELCLAQIWHVGFILLIPCFVSVQYLQWLGFVSVWTTLTEYILGEKLSNLLKV